MQSPQCKEIVDPLERGPQRALVVGPNSRVLNDLNSTNAENPIRKKGQSKPGLEMDRRVGSVAGRSFAFSLVLSLARSFVGRGSPYCPTDFHGIHTYLSAGSEPAGIHSMRVPLSLSVTYRAFFASVFQKRETLYVSNKYRRHDMMHSVRLEP